MVTATDTSGMPHGGEGGSGSRHHMAGQRSPKQAVSKARMYDKVDKGVWERVIGKNVRCVSVDSIPAGHSPCNLKCFAKWRTLPMPKGAQLDRAIDAIESLNCTEPKMIRSQIVFEDGSLLRFQRSNVEDASSLFCTGYFTPPAAPSLAADQRSISGPLFIVNDAGHLLHRKPRQNASHNTLSIPPEKGLALSTGSCSFSFTPVGFMSHQVRPNTVFAGVRPGLRETSLAATQFRPRPGPTAVPRSNASCRSWRPPRPRTAPAERFV